MDKSASNRSRPVNRYAPPGAAHLLSIDGTPAVYLGAVAGQRIGSPAVAPDPSIHQLVLARDGAFITITAWRDSGLDRAALERLAASLHGVDN